MALLNISAAARAAGKDRNTIKRYLKNGILSSTFDAAGKVVIDSAELMRVFGTLTGDGNASASEVSPVCSSENNTIHQLAIESLREQLRAAQERETWLRAQLEAEQERSRELERKVLPPARPEQDGAGKQGFWARLFG